MNKKYQLDFLREYYEDDDESLKIILQLYLEETPKDLNAIATHLKNQDTEKAKIGVHKIKTNIAMLGIHEAEPFIDIMHDQKSEAVISPDLIEMFKNFRIEVEEALKQIHEDFFSNESN